MIGLASAIATVISAAAFFDLAAAAKKWNIKFDVAKVLFGICFFAIVVLFAAQPAFAQTTTTTKVTKVDTIKIDTQNADCKTTKVVVSNDAAVVSSPDFKINMGPMKVFSMSASKNKPGKMSIVVMGETTEVEIDTSQMPAETLEAFIESLAVAGKTISMKDDGNFHAFAFGDEDEDEEENEGGFWGMVSNLTDSFAKVVIILIVFLTLALMLLGVPLLLVIFLYKHGQWIHEERMRAIEEGMPADIFQDNTGEAQVKKSLRKGMSLIFVGAGIGFASILLLGKFFGAIAVILIMWGLGNVVWAVSQQKKTKPVE